MKFFIVTPTYNSLRWLPTCIASVKNQIFDDVQRSVVRGQASDNLISDLPPSPGLWRTGRSLNSDLRSPISVHHHIQDGGSTDGTVDWLERYAREIRGQTSEVGDQRAESGSQRAAGSGADGSSELRSPISDLGPAYTFSYSSEKDAGMYDAINKGWDRAEDSVDWLGHLNSDEQYQPGVLARIAQAGAVHPQWGAITGNCIWVNEQGEYLCSRKPSVGWPWVGRIWIPAATCALFIRRKFYGPNAVRFDTSWKSFGDKVFCRDLLNAGCKFGYLDEYMALFTHRGDANLGFQPVTEVERARYWEESLSPLERRFSPGSIFAARASRVLRNRFGAKCRDYVWIDSSGVLQKFEVKNHRWMI